MDGIITIATAKHRLTMDDMYECYSLLINDNNKKALRTGIDIMFVVLCAFYTALSAFYLLASPPHKHTIADTAIILLMIFILVLTIMHFVKKLITKKRYAAMLFNQVKTRRESDHAEYYSDRVVIFFSNSHIELSFSDTKKLIEGKNVFILVAETGASHIGRKDCFTNGSFDDFRRAYFGYKPPAEQSTMKQ